jgi:hypothetical protein
MKKTLLSVLCISGALVSNAQWIDQPTNGAQSRGVRYIDIVDSKTVWAVLYDGSGSNANIQELYKTVDGQTWKKLVITTASGNYGVSNVSGIDTSIAYAAVYPASTSTAKQGVYRTTDGGYTWTKISGSHWGASSFIDGVYFWNAAEGFAFGDPVGGSFQIETTTDSGKTWVNAVTTVPALNSSEYGYVGVFDAYGDQVWLGTNTGRILHSVDRGKNWTVAQTPLTDIQEVKFFSPSWGFARQIDNQNSINDLVETTDSGATWHSVITSGDFYTAGFDMIPGTNVFISTGAAQNANGTSYSTDSARTWTILENGIQRLEVAFYSDSIGWCGGFSDGSGTTGMFAWDPSFTGIVTSLKNTTSIQQNAGFSVYPNPNNGSFVVNYSKGNSSVQNSIQLKVLNVLGEEIYSETVNSTALFKQVTLEGVKSGIYFVKVADGNTSNTTKIIVK